MLLTAGGAACAGTGDDPVGFMKAAAPLAMPIFEIATVSMTLTDAQRNVSGGGHFATGYFDARPSTELKNAFTPMVKNAWRSIQ